MASWGGRSRATRGRASRCRRLARDGYCLKMCASSASCSSAPRQTRVPSCWCVPGADRARCPRRHGPLRYCGRHSWLVYRRQAQGAFRGRAGTSVVLTNCLDRNPWLFADLGVGEAVQVPCHHLAPAWWQHAQRRVHVLFVIHAFGVEHRTLPEVSNVPNSAMAPSSRIHVMQTCRPRTARHCAGPGGGRVTAPHTGCAPVAADQWIDPPSNTVNTPRLPGVGSTFVVGHFKASAVNVRSEMDDRLRAGCGAPSSVSPDGPSLPGATGRDLASRRQLPVPPVGPGSPPGPDPPSSACGSAARAVAESRSASARVSRTGSPPTSLCRSAHPSSAV